MELRDLRTFAAVARLLSFHRAAAELNAAQSTVSARIAALETELGLRLFERLGRRVALTDAGERLVQYAAKLIDVEDEARAWVTGESRLRGLLTVRVPESLCAYRLPPVIAAFRRRHPEVALHLTACTMNGLEKDLRQGITDLAFVMADSVRGGDLNVEALGMEPLVLVAAPHHPLATRDRVTARDLHGVTLVLSTADCAYRAVIEEALAAEGVHPAAGLEFSSVAALRGCVASGVGVTLLPEAAVRDELRAGTLRALAWADQPFETAVLMVRHRGKWVSPYMDTFMELCRAACAEDGESVVNSEAVWDFPCPMADVATILEPPRSATGAAKRPDSTDQPALADAEVSPPAPSLPNTPDTPDTPAVEPEAAPGDMPGGMVHDAAEAMRPEAVSETGPDDAPDTPDCLPDNLLLAPPTSDSTPWSDSWSDAGFMDDADSGPETVWGNPPDMAPEMDAEMVHNSFADSLPDSFADSLPDVPWTCPDDFSGLELADAPCAREDDAADNSGHAGPGDRGDMPLYAPEQAPPAGSAPEQATDTVPPAPGLAPEVRQPSLWDLPEAPDTLRTPAVHASDADTSDESDTPTVPHEPAEPTGLPATPEEPARPATPERSPEPAPEAPQWLSLLPPKR